MKHRVPLPGCKIRVSSVVLEECADTFTMMHSTNCLVKDVSAVILRVVEVVNETLTSANTLLTSKTSSFGHLLWCSTWLTLLVTTTLSNAEALIRSIASPLNTPCVTKAYTRDAPSFFNNFAARVMVLEVSAKSSIKIAVRLATSPTSIIVAF